VQLGKGKWCSAPGQQSPKGKKEQNGCYSEYFKLKLLFSASTEVAETNKKSQYIIVNVVMFLISVRGGYCDFSSRASICPATPFSIAGVL
jgi:hypothetical protein